MPLCIGDIILGDVVQKALLLSGMANAMFHFSHGEMLEQSK